MTTPRYPVTVATAPPLARFEIVGSRSDLAATLVAAGLPAPTSNASWAPGAGGTRVGWIGPRRMIVTTAQGDRERWGTLLRAAVPTGTAVAVAEVTGATVTFSLRGSGVDSVLSQGFAHDLATLREGTDRFLATDAWGVAALIEQIDGGVAITVEASFGDFIEHMLRTAAGLPTSSKPGVMSAPPPPVRVVR